MSKNERLEVEDEDARRERLGKLFADFSESKAAAEPASVPNPEGPSRPFAMPESDVLARVRAFLPDFQASTNEILAQAATDPDAVNLERVRKGEGAVAIDLGLGVYDAPGLKGKEAGSGLGPVVDSSGSVPDQEEEESSGEDEDDTSKDESSSDEEGTEDEPVETTAPTQSDDSK